MLLKKQKQMSSNMASNLLPLWFQECCEMKVLENVSEGLLYIILINLDVLSVEINVYLEMYIICGASK